jgi:hypothetical protein
MLVLFFTIFSCKILYLIYIRRMERGMNCVRSVILVARGREDPITMYIYE